VDLSNGGGFKELRHFQDNLSYYQTIVFNGLNPDRDIYSGNSRSSKKFHLLYDRDNEHYNVITNLKRAVGTRVICNGCETLYDFRTNVTKVFSLCTTTPFRTKDKTKYCSTCNRRFLSRNVFRII